VLDFLVCVVKGPAGSADCQDMDSTGGVQIGLLGLQFLVAIASAYAGIRLVDDIRYIKGIPSRRESRD
jgi:hypothetical protein